jgi:hypothetical protein
VSEFWQGILLGALIAVPIGIISNLVTLPIQSALSRRVQTASDRQALADATFEAQAEQYAKDRTEFWSYLLEVLIRVAFIGALAGIISGFFIIVGQVMPIVSETINQTFNVMAIVPIEYLAGLSYAIAQVVALIGALLSLNITRPASTMVRRVRTINRTASNPTGV